MKKKILSILFALVLVLSFSLVATTPVAAATPVYVDASRPDDSGDGTSWATAKKYIQSGINIVDVGGTVHVAAGIYDEQLTIGKSLTLIGAGEDQTFLKESTASSPVITISADDVAITDLEITDDTQLPEGIRVVSGASSGLTIDRVDFTELGAGTGANAYGIYIASSFTDLSVTDCDFVAVAHTTYYRTVGIFAPNNLQLGGFEISDSTFEKIWTGIYLRSAIDGLDVIGNAFGSVQSSDFAACVSGIYIGDGSDSNFDIENIVVTDNTFTDYGRGVYVWNYANDATVSDFEIYGNTFTNSVWSSAIRFIAGLGDDEGVSFDGISVHDNIFTQDSDVGAHVALVDFRTYCELAYCDITVTDNKVTLSGGPYTDPWSGIAFLAYEGPFTNTVVDGNTLDGGSCGGTGTPPSTGVLVKHESSTCWPSDTLEMDIYCNDVTGFDHGIGIYDNVATLYGGLPTGSSVDIHHNSIHGNALYGVRNDNSAAIDATYNWWGDDSGPDGVGPGSGDAVSANVNYDPWLGAKTVTAPTGPVSFTSSDGAIENLTAVVPPSLPSVSFPHGMFSFEITGLSTGETVTVKITLPGPVPVGTLWWKYDNGQWYSLPNLSDDGDNIMVIQLTDGGSGDLDGVANGIITDPSGPGNPMTVGWDGSPVSKAAVLAPWIALLAAIMAGVGLMVVRRRRSQI